MDPREGLGVGPGTSRADRVCSIRPRSARRNETGTECSLPLIPGQWLRHDFRPKWGRTSMSVIDWALAVVATSAAVVAFAAVFIAGRTSLLFRRLEYASGDLRVVLQRLHRIAADLEGVTRDARATETRVSNTVNLFLDQTEPPLRVFTAALAGARAGIAALVRREVPGTDGVGRPRDRAAPHPERPS